MEVRNCPIHNFVHCDAHTRHILPYFLPFFLAIYFIVSYREGGRGSRVTIVGFGANVLLTSANGTARWYMNSAALLADAGLSLSGKHALPTSCILAVLRYCMCPFAEVQIL